MKKNNKSSGIKEVFIFVVILFILINILIELGVSEHIFNGFLIASVLGVILSITIITIKKYKKLKANVKKLFWEDPEARKFQEIYENICKKNIIKIRDLRKKLLYGTIFIIISTVILIGLMLYIKLIEPIYFIIFVYVILQIAVIVINENNEKHIFEKNLKEFIETSNKIEYSLRYIDNSEKKYLKEIKDLMKEEYKKIDSWQKEDKSNEYETISYIYDCIEGDIIKDVHMKFSRIRSSYRVKSSYYNAYKWYHSYEGTFIILNKNLNENIEILLKKYNRQNNLIAVSNERFNNYFEINAEKKENVNNIITEEIIDFIADFREKFEIDFEIFFKDKIYIKFYTMNLFNREGMTEKNIDILSPGQYYLMLKFITELLEKINT